MFLSVSREWRLGVVVLLLATAACVRQVTRVDVGQDTPSPLYEKPYAIGCGDAHRYAVKAMKTLNYKLTAIQRGPAGGRVTGVRGEEATLVITCAADGVRVKADLTGGWAQQGLQFSFNQVAETGDRIWPPPTAPRVVVEIWRGVESKAWFAQEIESHGVVAARIRIVNGGTRPLSVDPSGIVALAAAGRAHAIAGPSAKQRLAAEPEIDAVLLGPVKLTQGQTAAGFVFFPVADYETVSIPVTDVPTGESDQYDFAIPPAVR